MRYSTRNWEIILYHQKQEKIFGRLQAKLANEQTYLRENRSNITVFLEIMQASKTSSPFVTKLKILSPFIFIYYFYLFI